nr:transcription factor FAMA [Ipomoea batatas]
MYDILYGLGYGFEELYVALRWHISSNSRWMRHLRSNRHISSNNRYITSNSGSTSLDKLSFADVMQFADFRPKLRLNEAKVSKEETGLDPIYFLKFSVLNEKVQGDEQFNDQELGKEGALADLLPLPSMNSVLEKRMEYELGITMEKNCDKESEKNCKEENLRGRIDCSVAMRICVDCSAAMRTALCSVAMKTCEGESAVNIELPLSVPLRGGVDEAVHTVSSSSTIRWGPSHILSSCRADSLR